MPSKIFLSIIGCLALAAYAWLVAVLLLTRQTDVLLLVSIAATTFFLWSIWYAFLHKKKLLLLLCILLGLLSIGVTFMAAVVVMEPELVGMCAMKIA